MADNVIPFPGAEAEPDDAPPFSQADIQAITQQLIDELGSPEAVLQALGAFGGFEPFGGRGPFDLMSPRPKPKLLRKRSKRATTSSASTSMTPSRRSGAASACAATSHSVTCTASFRSPWVGQTPTCTSSRWDPPPRTS